MFDTRPRTSSVRSRFRRGRFTARQESRKAGKREEAKRSTGARTITSAPIRDRQLMSLLWSETCGRDRSRPVVVATCQQAAHREVDSAFLLGAARSAEVFLNSPDRKVVDFVAVSAYLL